MFSSGFQVCGELCLVGRVHSRNCARRHEQRQQKTPVWNHAGQFIAQLLVVVEKTEDVVVGEAGAAFEEVELDGDGDAGDDAAEALD